MTPPATSALSSTPERIEVLDALRGVALSGIVLINFTAFVNPGAPPGLGVPVDAANRLAVQFIIALVESKFFTLFSFLFGIGFALQLSGSEPPNASGDAGFEARFFRRIAALGIFGIAHIVFLWAGDILLLYALVGVILFRFRRADDATITRWAVVLLASLFLVITLGNVALAVARALPESAAALRNADHELMKVFTSARAAGINTLLNAPYEARLIERLKEYVETASLLLTRVPVVLAMFLTGFYVGKRGFIRNVSQHEALLRRVRFAGLLSGGIASCGVTVGYFSLPPVSALAMLFYNQVLAGPLLSMGYAAAIVLAAQRRGGSALLQPFTATGRMALTNYIAQSLACSVLVSGYGFGLAGKLTYLQCAGIALALTVLQMAYSAVWLRYFAFGPLEWIWRWATYRRRPKLRRGR